MSAPLDKLRNLVYEALKVYYKYQGLRSAFARAASDLLNKFSQDLTVFEVNSYPAFASADPRIKREWRVWPQTLTGPVEGWLANRPYMAQDRIMPINWAGVFSALAPTFNYNKSVLDSVRNILSMMADVNVEPADVDLTGVAGRCKVGRWDGFYRITPNGIEVTYFNAEVGSYFTWTAAYPDYTEMCEVAPFIHFLSRELADAIDIKCETGTVRVSPDGSICPQVSALLLDLKYLESYKWYCTSPLISSVAFESGPLAGTVITGGQAEYIGIGPDGVRKFDKDRYAGLVATVRQVCRETMNHPTYKSVYCTGTAP